MISRLLPVSNFLSAGAWLLQTAATNPRIAPGLAAGKRGATLKANRAHHLFGHRIGRLGSRGPVLSQRSASNHTH
jgi:hypothetical protein